MPEEKKQNEKKQDGIITELKIPPELIKNRDAIFSQNQPRYATALSIMRTIALLAWVVAVLAIVMRLNDGSREYGFARMVGGQAVERNESAQRVFVEISAAALALGSIGCLIGAILCTKGASTRSGSGRFMLILSVLSLLMAIVLYVFW